MQYLDKVKSRLDVPGLIIIVTASLMVYFSNRIAEKLFSGHISAASLVIKVTGCALALFGALVLLDIVQIW